MLCNANEKAEANLVAKMLAVDFFLFWNIKKWWGKQYGNCSDASVTRNNRLYCGTDVDRIVNDTNLVTMECTLGHISSVCSTSILVTVTDVANHSVYN